MQEKPICTSTSQEDGVTLWDGHSGDGRRRWPLSSWAFNTTGYEWSFQGERARINSICPPVPDQRLSSVYVPTENLDTKRWIVYRLADESDKAVPSTYAPVEAIVMPCLAMSWEGLRQERERTKRR